MHLHRKRKETKHFHRGLITKGNARNGSIRWFQTISHPSIIEDFELQILWSITARRAASATSLAYWSTPERARKRETRCAITPTGSHERETDTFAGRIARVLSGGWIVRYHADPLPVFALKNDVVQQRCPEREKERKYITCRDVLSSRFFHVKWLKSKAALY